MNRHRARRTRRSYRFALNQWRYRLKRGFILKRSPFRRGFTLTELLVASLLLSVVMLIAWTGLVSALNMSNIAEAKTARKTELSRALNFMNQEIRQAQAVNQSGILKADGSTVSLEDVVSNSGLNLSDLGNYGDLALYLEVPTNGAITTCPAEDGFSQIPADTVDQVVYDVRSSPSEWLAPKAIARYGRIPSADGSINPCSAPVTGDIMADAITDINETPFCDGVLTGGAGFHACMEGDAVNLLVQSAIRDVDGVSVSSTVTPRIISFNPDPLVDMAATLQSFRNAFDDYFDENGSYPLDNHIVLPAGMEDRISEDIWLAETAIGGNYNWEGSDYYAYAGISILGATAPNSDIARLDQLIDDGNLSTGNFRLTPNGRHTWIFQD